MSGTEKQCKKQQKWAKMAKNETEFGLYVALNYFSHLPLCLSEKIRRCFKSFDNLEKTSDFFRSLAETDYHYCGVRLKELISLIDGESRELSMIQN